MSSATQDIELEVVKILEGKTSHDDALDICEIIDNIMNSNKADEFVILMQKWLASS